MTEHSRMKLWSRGDRQHGVGTFSDNDDPYAHTHIHIPGFRSRLFCLSLVDVFLEVREELVGWLDDSAHESKQLPTLECALTDKGEGNGGLECTTDTTSITVNSPARTAIASYAGMVYRPGLGVLKFRGTGMGMLVRVRRVAHNFGFFIVCLATWQKNSSRISGVRITR